MRIGSFLALGVLLWPTVAVADVDAGLHPLGADVQVNPEHALDQQSPVVGLALDGSGLVLWTGDDQAGKRGRTLDRLGRPSGPQFSVNPPPDFGFSTYFGADFGVAGSGFACWAPGGPCFCRGVDTLGHLGSEAFRCSENDLGPIDSELEPRVAMFPDGSFAVVWLLYATNLTSSSIVIQGRYFDASGRAVGTAFELPWSTLAPHLEIMDIAPLANRRLVVVWTGREPSGAGDDIFARIVGPAGQPEGETFTVNSHIDGDQVRLSVDSNREDRFVVVWDSDGQDGSFGGVYGQLFDDRGARIGGEFQVSSNALSDQTLPEVAMDRLGNFTVSYFSGFEGPELGEDTFLRAYRPDGSPRSAQVRANDEVLYQQQFATLDLSDNGLLQVAFESWRRPEGAADYDWDIMTRRFMLACEPDAHTLCLGEGGRFQVRAFWRTPADERGAGSTLPLTTDTGGFYFFSPGNFELLVKVLDGCSINGRYWIYSAGLTDVEVELIVTDTYTGEVQVFENPLGQAFQPIQRIDLLAGCGAPPPGLIGDADAEKTPPVAPPAPDLGAVACPDDPTALCLRDGRFRVRAGWRDFIGQSGSATPFPVTDEAGLFHFFSPGNLELAVKVLDGCAINQRFWVFAVGLTNVAVTLDVEDTRSGQTWHRETTLGEAFPPILDIAGFATCP